MNKGIQSWKALIKYISYYFSIGGLLRTLFVPWRQERYVSEEQGLWRYVEQGTFYLFAVVVGIVARTITITIGLFVLLLGLLLFPFFAIFPISLTFQNLVRGGSLGREWAYAKTWTLDKHGRDMRSMAEVLVIDHDTAVEQIERVLSRKTQQNVLITGSQGIGKTTRLGYLARQMYRDLSVPALNGKRLVQLFIEEMTIDTIQECIQEAISARNVVLVIENIERFNIISVIEPYLDNNHFQMILTTDWANYNATYKHHENLMRACEVVEMYPPDQEITLQYLDDWVHLNRESRRMDHDILAATVVLTDKLMMNATQPEKSIDILEELAGLPDKEITVEHVEKLMSQKTNVPLGALNRNEKELLINLEDILKEHVIGQNPAVRAISSALKRGRAGSNDSPKPIGSFLFLGPTGVGKTHTAKMLAQYYFGGEHMMIRFDMSEFRELDSMSRFIERLGNQVEASPFALVFFDEIEKAHPDILNLFLQILDEGEFRTQAGRKISFRNTIIICTSNAGAQYMMQNESESEDLIINHIVEKGILRPEFINRFDATILYQPLDRHSIQRVTIIMLNALNKHIRKKHNLEILITPELVEVIARKGHHPQFGVRPLARVIQDDIETHIADQLLSEQVPEFLSLYINPESIEL